MAYPSQSELEIPLLHLVAAAGGVVRARDTYTPLADYFNLNEVDRHAALPKNPSIRRWSNSIQWARQRLVNKGLLTSGGHGIWRITDAGRDVLRHRSLLARPFPFEISVSHKATEPSTKETLIGFSNHELLAIIAEELRTQGLRLFPDDFLPGDAEVLFREIEVPPVSLGMAAFSTSKITAYGLPFSYDAKSPAEAKYILFAHCPGKTTVLVPDDPRLLFRVVKQYEAYVRETQEKILKRFVELTHDGIRARDLSSQLLQQMHVWGLKCIDNYNESLVSHSRHPEVHMDTLDIQQLATRLEALSAGFENLAQKMSEAIDPLRDPGILPPAELVTELAESRQALLAIRANVLRLAISLFISPIPKEQELDSLGAIRSLLHEIALAQEGRAAFEDTRKKALSVIDRVLLITHTEGASFTPVEDCRAQARQLRFEIESIAWPTAHPDISPLADGSHAFARLLRMLEDREQIADEEWLSLEDLIDAHFGKALRIALTRGKLMVRRQEIPPCTDGLRPSEPTSQTALPHAAAETPREGFVLPTPPPEEPVPSALPQGRSDISSTELSSTFPDREAEVSSMPQDSQISSLPVVSGLLSRSVEQEGPPQPELSANKALLPEEQTAAE